MLRYFSTPLGYGCQAWWHVRCVLVCMTAECIFLDYLPIKKKGGMSVICISQEPFIWSTSHLVGLLLRTQRNLNKRGKGVITSANLALVPACGDASQHISVVWLQMNECLQKMKVHNPESRLTTELFIDVLFLPWFRSEMTSIRSVIAVLSAVFGWTCLVQSQHYHPNQSINQSLKCAPHFLAFLHQKS